MLRHRPLNGMQLRWIAYAKTNASGTVTSVVRHGERQRVPGRLRERRRLRSTSRNWRGRRTRRRLSSHAAHEDHRERHRQEDEQRNREQQQAAACGKRLGGQRQSRRRAPVRRQARPPRSHRLRPRHQLRSLLCEHAHAVDAKRERPHRLPYAEIVQLVERVRNQHRLARARRQRSSARQNVPRKSMRRDPSAQRFGSAATSPSTWRSSGRR